MHDGWRPGQTNQKWWKGGETVQSRSFLSRVGLRAIVRDVWLVTRDDLSVAMRRVHAPGTFGVDNRDDESVIRLVHTGQTLARQALAGKTPQNTHLEVLDCASPPDV